MWSDDACNVGISEHADGVSDPAPVLVDPKLVVAIDFGTSGSAVSQHKDDRRQQHTREMKGVKGGGAHVLGVVVRSSMRCVV
jgi:hypothetical protein